MWYCRNQAYPHSCLSLLSSNCYRFHFWIAFILTIYGSKSKRVATTSWIIFINFYSRCHKLYTWSTDFPMRSSKVTLSVLRYLIKNSPSPTSHKVTFKDGEVIRINKWIFTEYDTQLFLAGCCFYLSWKTLLSKLMNGFPSPNIKCSLEWISFLIS